jgi:hypothetical protein
MWTRSTYGELKSQLNEERGGSHKAVGIFAGIAVHDFRQALV